MPQAEYERDILQIKAMDSFTNGEGNLKGCRVSADQELPYPRSGVCANGFNIASDTIPSGIKRGLLELAIQVNGSELLINSSSTNVKRKKLGPLETEYFSGGSSVHVKTGKADAYLKPYKNNNGNNNLLERTMR